MMLTLTKNAANKIVALIEEELSSESLMFRVMVSGGGCSGFQYGFSLDNKRREDDQLFEDQGVHIIIDEASLALIEGSQLDYVEELIGASFQLKNPNASSSCGCGNSFSL